MASHIRIMITSYIDNHYLAMRFKHLVYKYLK